MNHVRKFTGTSWSHDVEKKRWMDVLRFNAVSTAQQWYYSVPNKRPPRFPTLSFILKSTCLVGMLFTNGVFCYVSQLLLWKLNTLDQDMLETNNS